MPIDIIQTGVKDLADWVSGVSPACRVGAMAVIHEITLDEPVCGKDTIAFDEHAIKRMNERKVTEAQVIATLRYPDVTGLRADPGRLRVRRHYGSHASIDVVYEVEKTRLVVISAIRVSRN